MRRSRPNAATGPADSSARPTPARVAADITSQIAYQGLIFVQRTLHYNWNTYPPAQKEQIKAKLQEMLEGSSRPVVNEPAYYQEKYASLLVEVAKRDFPQEWLGFLPWLLQCMMRLPRPALVALKTLRTLVEETADNEFNSGLPSGRRQDIMTALKESLDMLLAQMAQMLVPTVAVMGSAPEATDLARNWLGVMRAVSAWAAPEKLKQHNVIHHIITLMKYPAVAVRRRAPMRARSHRS